MAGRISGADIDKALGSLRVALEDIDYRSELVLIPGSRANNIPWQLMVKTPQGLTEPPIGGSYLGDNKRDAHESIVMRTAAVRDVVAILGPET